MAIVPIVFIILVLVFNYLNIKSWKPIDGNPVVFHDDGNPWYLLGAAISFIGFVISLMFVALS